MIQSKLLASCLMVLSFGLSEMSLADDFTGTLQLDSSVTLIKSRIGRNRPMTLSPGNYQTSVDIHSDRLTLDINGDKFRFEFPRSTVIPSDNGSVLLTGSTNSQNIDLNFEVNTERRESAQYTNVESCIYGSMPRTVCTYRPYSCYTVYDNIYGSHQVTRHNVVSDHFYNLELGHSGSLKAQTRDTNAVVDFETRCEL